MSHGDSEQGYKLAREIVALSVADRWDHARSEWQIEAIYIQPTPETCLCGHFPINEICVLRNTKNRNTAVVGNICVNKFMQLRSDKVFDAVKRVAADETRALNVEAIAHAFARGWINEWERKFYIGTWKLRRLSANRKAKRIEINRKVLARVRTNR